jgi:hypothetical protein
MYIVVVLSKTFLFFLGHFGRMLAVQQSLRPILVSRGEWVVLETAGEQFDNAGMGRLLCQSVCSSITETDIKII